MPYDPAALYSVVQNSSGVSKRFPCLPPHGRTLAADEEVTLLGDAYAAVIRGGRPQRHLTDFVANLNAGLLTLVSQPAPILYDETLAASKLVGVDNGSVTLADPVFESSESESVSA